VSAAGISPLPKHVEALQGLPVPTDVKQLQRFLGLINFYRRFFPVLQLPCCRLQMLCAVPLAL
jgi:hypothetical protein